MPHGGLFLVLISLPLRFDEVFFHLSENGCWAGLMYHYYLRLWFWNLGLV